MNILRRFNSTSSMPGNTKIIYSCLTGQISPKMKQTSWFCCRNQSVVFLNRKFEDFRNNWPLWQNQGMFMFGAGSFSFLTTGTNRLLPCVSRYDLWLTANELNRHDVTSDEGWSLLGCFSGFLIFFSWLMNMWRLFTFVRGVIKSSMFNNLTLQSDNWMAISPATVLPTDWGFCTPAGCCWIKSKDSISDWQNYFNSRSKQSVCSVALEKILLSPHELWSHWRTFLWAMSSSWKLC